MLAQTELQLRELKRMVRSLAEAVGAKGIGACGGGNGVDGRSRRGRLEESGKRWGSSGKLLLERESSFGAGGARRVGGSRCSCGGSKDGPGRSTSRTPVKSGRRSPGSSRARSRRVAAGRRVASEDSADEEADLEA